MNRRIKKLVDYYTTTNKKDLGRRTGDFDLFFLKNVITVSTVVKLAGLTFHLYCLIITWTIKGMFLIRKERKTNHTEAFLKASVHILASLFVVLGQKSRENVPFH